MNPDLAPKLSPEEIKAIDDKATEVAASRGFPNYPAPEKKKSKKSEATP